MCFFSNSTSSASTTNDNTKNILSSGKDVPTYIQQQLTSTDILVFSRTRCIHCMQNCITVKKLLHKHKRKYNYSWKVLELDELQGTTDGPMIQNYLMKTTKKKMVPHVFIKGKFVGGSKRLQVLFSKPEELELLLLGGRDDDKAEGFVKQEL
eukprot:CAMPEP_0185731012 /NCGR_PEP_ID=MMETSP1171-20130828/11562_1 /TAXON_ID=374046 /ORGANISM="Helicotheca tamensis, Strain CCMP826" /LENGTH=151 /DNA_ID=CAMNT_0028400171 /DNA_START=62 /DNA_END=517 /DNA_ORIENTATION=+